MPDVLVTENIAGSALDELAREFDVQREPDLWKSSERLIQLSQAARALIVRNQTQVTAQLIQQASNLEVIARAGAGLDNIDVKAASAAGIPVTFAPHDNSLSVAELAIGLMLALARNITAASDDTHRGGWNRSKFTGIELAGKRLGIVGLGRIGTLVAERARALGMEILAHDDYLPPNAPQIKQLDARLLSIEQLLREADFVSCHVPLTPETASMFDRERFQQMKDSAYFINTSRGEVVDEAALAELIGKGQLAGAALDVRSVEPPQSQLFDGLDQVILTPHIAAFTEEAQQRVVATVCRDVASVLRGGSAAHQAM